MVRLPIVNNFFISRAGKPLPKELADFISGAGEAGVIFMSMGSVVR